MLATAITNRPSPPSASRWTLWTGRIVLTVWAAFWIWFNVAAGIGEMSELGPIALLPHGLMAAVILGACVVAWRWRLVGGILLLALAALFAGVFGFGVAAILLAPPTLAGLLLIASDVAATPIRRRK